MERIETTILRNLIFDEEYSRKVIPFIEPVYFENKTEKIVFQEATQFIVKYDSAITIEALNIEIENRTDLTETEIKEARDITKTFDDAPVDSQWLTLNSTEKWCRDRAIYLALMESIDSCRWTRMTKKEGMLFLAFSLTLWLFLSIIM